MASKQALVFGASGISGWAIVRECLSYPSEETFSRIVALANKSLSNDDFLLSSENRKRIEAYSGIDLSQGTDAAIESLKKIADIDQITHVYYTAYSPTGMETWDLGKIFANNLALHTAAFTAIITLCPALEFYVLQTGGKGYGVEFAGQPGISWPVPIHESTPRLSEPYASMVFYYGQHDEVERAHQQTGQKWCWCETRPDGIIGFTPRGNGIGLAQCLGLWLSMYRSFEGEKANVVFPGNEASWKHVHNNTAQDLLARFTIHASLADGDKVNGKAFNIAEEPLTWEQLWPEICAYFNLNGTGPGHAREDNSHGPANKSVGIDWVYSKKPDWGRWVKENGLKEGMLETASWEFARAVFDLCKFDRQFDITASKAIGFQEHWNPAESYHLAFDRMRQAKIIPPS